MADRRQFLRTLGGAAALSFTANIRSFGSARQLSMSMAMPNTGEHDRRQPEWDPRKIKQVQTEMKKHRLNAMVLLHASNVIYTTGYFHLSTERPLAVLIPDSGEPVLFIPGLESDQVKLWWVKDYEAYYESRPLDLRTNHQARAGTGAHRGGRANAQPVAPYEGGRAEGSHRRCRRHY